MQNDLEGVRGVEGTQPVEGGVEAKTGIAALLERFRKYFEGGPTQE